jgi:nucleotide-binding universal stress UspA family protein
LAPPKIIAPVDFSEASRRGAIFAARLACHFHSELTLLHVMEPCGPELTVSEFNEWLLPDEFRNMDVRRVMLSGDPASEIVNFARSRHASLVVIPTHGYSPLRQCLLGSVAAKILHDADWPILSGVHMSVAFPDETRRFQKILCAVDFCPQAAKALEWASQFADEFHAELTIAHITPSTEGRAGEYFNPEVHGRWAMETRQGEFLMRAREKLEALRKNAGANATVFINSSNDIPQAVCSAASELEADLVVVGRGSSEGIERLRTKVYSIVRQSPSLLSTSPSGPRAGRALRRKAGVPFSCRVNAAARARLRRL